MSDSNTLPNPEHAKLIAEAGFMLSSFNWKLQRAGYPFPPPPGLRELLIRIDAALFPGEVERPKGRAREKVQRSASA